MEETKYPIWAKPHSRDDELATAIRRAVTANFRRTADGGAHVQRAEVNFAIVEYPRRNKPAREVGGYFSRHLDWRDRVRSDPSWPERRELARNSRLNCRGHLVRRANPIFGASCVGRDAPGARWTHDELEEVALAGGRALLFMLLDNKFNRPMTGAGKDCDSHDYCGRSDRW